VGEFAWFFGWIAAVAILFVAALRLPHWCWSAGNGPLRFARIVVCVVLMIAVTFFAYHALVRHDANVDLTREHVYTPDSATIAVVDSIDAPVSLTYFYRGDDPAGARARRIVERLERRNPLLEVVTSDPDRDPTLAKTAGVKLYNAALLESGGRRVIVQGTHVSDIARGIERVLRRHVVTLCFMTGHGEYPSDNYEFHTHVEALGAGGHDHGAGTGAVVETVAHGVGRLRRSIEALGHSVLEISPATDGMIDPVCEVLIDPGPRTPYSDVEISALSAFLANGGAALLLYDIGLQLDTAHAAWLSRFGIRAEAAVVTDKVQHYAGDVEMVAATSYPLHPITEKLSFTFFPGVRPLILVSPESGISTVSLVESSGNAQARPLAVHADDHDHQHLPQGGVQVLAAAASGKMAPGDKPFRLVAVGDSDFASNSFYPYMSNSRLLQASIGWLIGGQERTVASEPVGLIETIELSVLQQRLLFGVLVVALPLGIGGIGLAVWWRRR